MDSNKMNKYFIASSGAGSLASIGRLPLSMSSMMWVYVITASSSRYPTNLQEIFLFWENEKRYYLFRQAHYNVI